MALKIRLARGGSKKRPYYRVVVANADAPRDGRFVERVGSYNPLLGRESAQRQVFDADRIKYWVSQGAQPTDTVARLLHVAGIITDKKFEERNKIGEKNRQEREKAAAEAAKLAAEEAKKAAAEAAKKAKEDAAQEAAAAKEAAAAAATATEEPAPAEEASASEEGQA